MLRFFWYCCDENRLPSRREESDQKHLKTSVLYWDVQNWVNWVKPSQFHQPTCFWKWVGGTNPFKSGILSSEADPEKNIHCSCQVGHIIGTCGAWILWKCLRKKIFLHNFCHNWLLTILPRFDHSPPPIWSLDIAGFVGFLFIFFIIFAANGSVQNHISCITPYLVQVSAHISPWEWIRRIWWFTH